MADLSVFNQLGAIRDCFSDDEIKALSPARQEAWAVLIAANTATLESEDEERKAMSLVSLRVKELRAAEVALGEARPKVTHAQIAREHARAGRGEVGSPPDPEAEKRIAKAAAAADKANLALASAHRTKAIAEAKTKGARVVFARALQGWTASGPVLKQRDLIAAVAKTQADRDRVAQQERAVTLPSVLDEVLRGSGGKRGPTNPRHRRMKLPSE